MEQDKFKELIKESLDSYTPEVPAHLWENIRAGIPVTPAASTAGGSAAAGSHSGMGIAVIAKWVAAVAVVASVAVWAWQDNADENAPEKTAQVEQQPQSEVSAATELQTENEATHSIASSTTESETAQAAPEAVSTDVANPIAQTDVSREATVTTETQLNKTIESEAVVQEEVVNPNDKNVRQSQNTQRTTGGVAGDQPTTKSGAEQQVAAEAKDKLESRTEEPMAVYPMVECGIVADKVLGEAPLTVAFKNVSEARSYEWNFDNGRKAYKEEATMTFDEPGNYSVQLVVTDFEGNQITDQVKITVVEASTCFVPNAFSPNGDGLNDFFMIQGNNISDVSIEIFRLDGSLVFEGKGLNARWDGADSQKSGNDQYMVVARYIRNDGKPGIEKTVLSVIRD